MPKSRLFQARKESTKGYNLKPTYTIIDWEKYGNDYPDLATNGIITHTQLMNHYLVHGRFESRQLSYKFATPQENIQNNIDMLHLFTKRL